MTVSFTKIQKISKKTSWFFLFRIRTKEKEYPPTWKKQINSLSLSRIGLQLSCTREAIKRESGESPEQSRCCKFIFWLRAIDFIATGKQIPGRRSQQEQVRRPTMQTRFTAFEEKALSLMNRTIRPSFHSPF